MSFGDLSSVVAGRYESPFPDVWISSQLEKVGFDEGAGLLRSGSPSLVAWLSSWVRRVSRAPLAIHWDRPERHTLVLCSAAQVWSPLWVGLSYIDDSSCWVIARCDPVRTMSTNSSAGVHGWKLGQWKRVATCCNQIFFVNDCIDIDLLQMNDCIDIDFKSM